ncbi:MAG: tyrosine-type recombinase/integrase [Planctomycetota bacterium]
MREAQAKAGRWCAGGHVFLSRRGTPYNGFPRGLWHRTLVRAGLEGRGLNGPHSLRRTFASLYEGPIRDLSELLGHTTIGTTALYLRGRSEAKRRAVDALDFSATTMPEGETQTG